MFPVLRLVTCAAVVCLASLVMPERAAAQTFDPDVYYHLRVRHSGKCLDVPFNSMANTTVLQQWDCNPTAQVNQLWTVVPTGSGTFRVVSANSGKCVDIAGASTANGAAVQQYDCNVGAAQVNQVFNITAAPTAGYWRLSAIGTALSPKCLDVGSMSMANGAPIQQWDCGPYWNSNQDWDIVAYTPRQTSTHLRYFGYYNEMAPSQLNNARDHANLQQNTVAGGASILPVTGGLLKSFMNVSGDPFIRFAGRNGIDAGGLGSGPCPIAPPGNPDDIYSRCPSEGGLRSDWLANYNATTKPVITANLANITALYFDESYAIMNHNLFSDAEVLLMLTPVMQKLKADFPTLPIMVANIGQHIAKVYPPEVDWYGVYCYEWSGGIPACKDDTLVVRPYSYLVSRMKALQPGKKYFVVANGVVTTPAYDQPALASAADYFFNTAMADPDVIGMVVWSHETLLSLPIVKEKYRFTTRALGFGCTEGLSCPALWP